MVRFQNRYGLNRCFLTMFGVVAKFPQWKFNSISPDFRGGNPVMLHLRYVIAHKMLFSPIFWHKNIAMGMPHFHDENPVVFRVWYAMAHRQGFASVYSVRINMLVPWRAEALQSIKHVDARCIHGSRQSHCDDCANNTAFALSTYGIRLEHIPILQGQELLWLERVTHVATRVHHTKCKMTHTHGGTHTHTHTYIYIYTYIMHNAITQSMKVNRHCQHSKVWPNKV